MSVATCRHFDFLSAFLFARCFPGSESAKPLPAKPSSETEQLVMFFGRLPKACPASINAFPVNNATEGNSAAIAAFGQDFFMAAEWLASSVPAWKCRAARCAWVTRRISGKVEPRSPLLLATCRTALVLIPKPRVSPNRPLRSRCKQKNRPVLPVDRNNLKKPPSGIRRGLFAGSVNSKN